MLPTHKIKFLNALKSFIAFSEVKHKIIIYFISYISNDIVIGSENRAQKPCKPQKQIAPFDYDSLERRKKILHCHTVQAAERELQLIS